MIAFVDERCGACGVEPICEALPVAPSTCHERAARQAAPSRLPARAQRDAALQVEIRRAFEENPGVCGVRKVRRPLRREGVPVARCTVARLMRGMGLAGVVRGKPVRTTMSDKAAPCPLDRVNRQVRVPAPNLLWASDFTCVGTSAFRAAKAPGPASRYAAFVVEPRGSPDIDAFARRIVGWRASRTARAGFVLDALEQALHERRPVHGETASRFARGGKLVRRSDRGSQCLALRCTERLAEAGIEPSVGSVGDACDNALAETINGLFKAEAMHRRGPWRSFEAVEFAALEWVDWFNNRRLLEPTGNVPPAEAARPRGRLRRRA